MRVHVHYSVHEQLFGPVIQALVDEYGVSAVSGFVWGEDQAQYFRDKRLAVEPLTIFTRDILDHLDETPADLEYLADWERRSGVLIQHIIFAERHLNLRYSYEQLLRIAELAFRRVEHDYDTLRPDVYFSEDVACLVSYIHWVVARDRGIRIVMLNNARIWHRVAMYSSRYQQYDRVDAIFPDTPPGTLSAEDLEQADAYIREFRNKPIRPPGLMFRSRLPVASRFDLSRLSFVARRWFKDSKNPTLRPPTEVVLGRVKRLVRSTIADANGSFERPRAGEKYVFYPLHFQPEATTLVLAPYFLHQVALLEDIAKSLPAGHRLYVKEHVISRGRWPLAFYAAIKRIPGVRLLGPGENAQELIQNAAAVAVITGTTGWEGLLFGKPVITFGQVFFNRFPLVYRAGEVAKQDWPELFRKAIFSHQHDDALLRRYVACIFKGTYPGLTGNPASLPQLLEPENIRKLITAVASELGLVQPQMERKTWSA